MKRENSSIIIYKEPDYAAVSCRAADMIAAQLILKSDSVLGLATGSTPEGMYAELIRRYQAGTIDFSKVITFNLDEYYDLEPTNPQSYDYYMREKLFRQVNLKAANIHLPKSDPQNLEQNIEHYNQLLAQNPRDIQVLGIGTNGHIGFNEPADQFAEQTHLLRLNDKTIEANARFFDSIDKVPNQAISMGIANIMSAKRILIMANGENKAAAVKEMLYGPISPNMPASVLRLHPAVTLIVDEAAGKYI